MSAPEASEPYAAPMRIPSSRAAMSGTAVAACAAMRIAEEMDDGRRLERGKHAGIELLRCDDALKLPARGGERGVVVAGCRDDLVDQLVRRVQIAPDEMGLERRRQHPIAIGRSVVQAGDARREQVQNLAGESASRLGVAAEQCEGRGIDGRVVGLRVVGGGGGTEGALVKRAALAEYGGARLARLGEGLVLLQPTEKAASVSLGSLVEAEFVIFVERKRGRAGVGEAEHRPVCERNIARETAPAPRPPSRRRGRIRPD